MSTELGDANGMAAQAPARAHVNRREVVLFGLLAYGLAWAWWGFLFFPYLGTLLTQSVAPTDLVGRAGAAMVLGMFAPMIAALIMRLFISKEGVKGSLGLWHSWKYYLTALVAPAIFAIAVVLIVQALGLGELR
jgi:hypothetical protein